ncbi:MAG TPA: four helix bundle protein [Vicinamibacterales bacterium]|nr:four helix bundle protein [Vicinamibacterales bacterium]
MEPADLLSRAAAFALAVLQFYRRLPKTQEAQIPGAQLLRSATGIAANYRAARRGRSRAEFIAKLGIVVEESDETVGWLEYMRDGAIATDPDLLHEAKELCAIFTVSLRTARRNAAERKNVNARSRRS